VEFPLLPLPIPEYPGTPERLLEFSSVQLFVSRAQATRADFQLTSRNAAAVSFLCAQLEGIPLAIELAAAWMSVLSPSQMLARMEKRLDLLVSRRRDVSPRHRTLRAAIESSVALLSDEARRFFTSLSVFRGGWTLPAAESVCAEPSALEYLTELADHSLILRVSGGEEEQNDEAPLRFRMLETLREFSAESLREQGEASVAEVEDRHIAFFTALVEEASPQLTGPDQGEWFRRLQADHDNIRKAMDTLDRRGEAIEALRLGGLLTGFWQIRGFITEGRQLLDRLLERAEGTAPPPLRAQALSGAGKLAYIQGDYTVARQTQDTCLAIYRAEGDAAGIARTLCELGNCEMLKSNYADAATFFEESLTAYRALGDKKGIALLLNNLGAISLAKGLPAVALPYLEESLPLSREIGHHRIVSLVLLNLATIWQGEGDFERAKLYYGQSLVVRRELGDEVGIGRVLEGMARVAMEEGDADTALHRFEESLVVRRKHEDRDGLASTLLYRGLTRIRLRHDFPGGADSLRECLDVCGQTGNRHFASYALDGFATIAAAQHQPALAARLWAAAKALRDVLGVTAKPKDARALSEEINTVRAGMGDFAFDSAWHEGLALSLDEAVTLATRDLPTAPTPLFSKPPLAVPV
jgi:tetratricopeptide (TPR) repeat protein